MALDSAALLAQVKELHDKDAFLEIIELLGPSIKELDYALNLELARAYINAANLIRANNIPNDTQADEFYAQANALLDRFGLQGKDHATYLFYKGYALYKLGLTNDAMLRFESAMQHIGLNSEEAKLLPTINKMLALCKSYDPDNTALSLLQADEDLLEQHIQQHFGKYQILFKTDRYELLHIAPHGDYKCNLILTKGLSGRKLNVPAGVDELTNSRIELALCLPESWEFQNSEGYNIWPLNTLCELINFILTTQDFVGFGYTFDQGKVLHSTVKFTGGMLTALGGYAKDAQSVVLSDNSHVHFFELVYLYPLELAFRQSHSAADLLELFRTKAILPSPVRMRQDVCAIIAKKDDAEKL